MQDFIFETLEEDIDNMLKSITYKYGEIGNFDIDDLSNYTLNKIKFYKVKLSNNYSREKNFIPPDNFRCIARVWGGKDSVRQIDNKWVYGFRCSRYKAYPNHLCNTHIKKNPHGIYNLDPPHNHYDKFKKI